MKKGDGINLTTARKAVDSSVQNTRGWRIAVSVDDAHSAHRVMEASVLFGSVTDVVRSCVIDVIIKRDVCVGRNNQQMSYTNLCINTAMRWKI
mmetsp:Transcript_22086/g.48030  ORF Transcript_22086/g.48030 Transcript_22086/m.48030 type:complete len:93 (-) Transcript_22086:196-474(-)